MYKKLLLVLSLIFVSHAYAIKVGVTAGPHVEIMEEVKKIAKEQNFEVEIIEFNDFILPNVVLDSNEISINSYQHQPYLEQQIRDRGYNFIVIGKNILLPMGIYSAKHSTLDAVKAGDVIVIPNDPTNGSRALLLLQTCNLIKLKNLDNPSLLDITENLAHIKIVEVEAPQIPRILADVDYAVVNTDWILQAGMNPKTALILEKTENNRYANLFVVKSGNENSADIKQLLSIYYSDLIKEFIDKRFNGAVLPVW